MNWVSITKRRINIVVYAYNIIITGNLKSILTKLKGSSYSFDYFQKDHKTHTYIKKVLVILVLKDPPHIRQVEGNLLWLNLVNEENCVKSRFSQRRKIETHSILILRNIFPQIRPISEVDIQYFQFIMSLDVDPWL